MLLVSRVEAIGLGSVLVELAWVERGATAPRIVRRARVHRGRPSGGPRCVDVTAQVRSALDEARMAQRGLVYVPHTTAGVSSRARRPGVARDLEMALERIVDDGWPWRHLEDGDGQPVVPRSRVAHRARSRRSRSSTGSSRSGTWQGIFFCEFDGPRDAAGSIVSTLALRDGCCRGRSGREGRGARAPDRLARVRRQRRRAPDGFVVFVRRGLPGDRVRARVTKVKRSYAEALTTEVLEPGPERVEAPCAHFPRLRRLPLPGSRLRGAARGEGAAGARCARAARRASPSRRSSRSFRPSRVFHYRNKLEYSFTSTPEGPALGFHRAGRWDEVLDDRALLAHDRPRQRDPRRRPGLGARGGAPGVRPGRRQTGYLRHLVVREGRNTGQALVQLVTAPGERFERRATSSRCCARFPEVRSIHWAVNDAPAEVTNLPTRLLWGEEAIEEELLGLRFRVRPNAFLQTNTRDGRAAVRARARRTRRSPASETVWDLYCGIGTIGLALAATR